MAEVSRRLGSGVYRLSSLKSSSSPSFSYAECHITVSTTCIGAWTSNSEVVAGQRICECQLVSGDNLSSTCEPEHVLPDANAKHKARRLSKRKSNNRVVCETLLSNKPCIASGHLFLSESNAKPLITLMSINESETHSQLYRSPRVHPLPRVNRMVRRVTWRESRGDVMTKFYPEAFGSPQQLRAYSTVTLTLTDQRSGQRLSLLGPHPVVLAAPNHRAYSWGSKNGDLDTPPLYRSRTAYYDILKVTPSATQSQIKTAYYKQSFIYHPDKNPMNEEATLRFSEISEAYSVLGSMGLRRKYDRGILSQSDVQGAGRPSSKETMATSRGSSNPQQQNQRQGTSRRFSNIGGKPIFDFDAFYQAHYGEQLERERQMRARKERQAQKHEEDVRKWKTGKMVEMTVVMLMATGGFIMFSLRS